MTTHTHTFMHTPSHTHTHTFTPQWEPEHHRYNFDMRRGKIGVEWFRGAETNITYNCLDRWVARWGNGFRVVGEKGEGSGERAGCGTSAPLGGQVGQPLCPSAPP